MRAFLLLASAFALSPAGAQSPADQAQQAPQKILDAQARGAASVVRPGDDKMTCEALQAEVFAIARSEAAGPAMRGQYLFELAQARKCAWLREGGAPAVGGPPAAAHAAPPPAVQAASPGVVQPGSSRRVPPGGTPPPTPGPEPPRSSAPTGIMLPSDRARPSH
ncbi:MAG TPA: hypothetical protein VFX89_20830 [Gammaproteobacteria bacterium]|nr:hypothetical protein [Gammaproteobacteria bacterium]